MPNKIVVIGSDIIDQKFTCPICGSRFFGTTARDGFTLSSPMEFLIGYCKGQALINPVTGKKGRGYVGCTFKWSRGDDKKYMSREVLCF